MEPHEAFDAIRDTPQIDRLLGRVLGAVADEQLRARVIGIKDAWQPIAYEVSGYLCGVESISAAGRPPVKRGRKPKEHSSAPLAEEKGIENQTTSEGETARGGQR